MKDRVVEVLHVSPFDLKPDGRNWKIHPQEQRNVLQAMRERLGNVAPVLARRDENGVLRLIDGHMRVGLAVEHEEESVAVLVVDVDEQEAGEVLATLDPISLMADVDAEKMLELRRDLQPAWAEAIGRIEQALGEDEERLADLPAPRQITERDMELAVSEELDRLSRRDYADTEMLTCPHCGDTFKARTRLVGDDEEQADD